MLGSLSSGFERAQAQHLVQHLLDDLGLLGRGHGHALFVEQALHHAADLGADAVLGQRRDALQVEHADQLAVDLRLQLEIAVGAAGGHGRCRSARGQGAIRSHLVSLELLLVRSMRLQLYPVGAVIQKNVFRMPAHARLPAERPPSYAFALIRNPKPKPSVKPGWKSTSLEFSGLALFNFPALRPPIWLDAIMSTVCGRRICCPSLARPRRRIICMKRT